MHTILTSTSSASRSVVIANATPPPRPSAPRLSRFSGAPLTTLQPPAINKVSNGAASETSNGSKPSQPPPTKAQAPANTQPPPAVSTSAEPPASGNAPKQPSPDAQAQNTDTPPLPTSSLSKPQPYRGGPRPPPQPRMSLNRGPRGQQPPAQQQQQQQQNQTKPRTQQDKRQGAATAGMGKRPQNKGGQDAKQFDSININLGSKPMRPNAVKQQKMSSREMQAKIQQEKQKINELAAKDLQLVKDGGAGAKKKAAKAGDSLDDSVEDSWGAGQKGKRPKAPRAKGGIDLLDEANDLQQMIDSMYESNLSGQNQKGGGQNSQSGQVIEPREERQQVQSVGGSNQRMFGRNKVTRKDVETTERVKDTTGLKTSMMLSAGKKNFKNLEFKGVGQNPEDAPSIQEAKRQSRMDREMNLSVVRPEKEVKEQEEIFEVGPEGMMVQDLSDTLAVDVADLIKALFLKGVLVKASQRLDRDTVKLAAAEFGSTVVDKDEDDVTKMARKDELLVEEDLEHLQKRDPVVTVMGHVDHGKTTLLDYIRSASVADGEAGGITQAIAAYNTSITVDGSTRRMCFIDTPGHAAFSHMRARGTKVTDIAIIIAGADDGVQPQTIEAIQHAREARVPIIVAVNKMDLPGVTVDKVYNEMSAQGVTPQDWGGDTPFVPISAKRGTGVDTLLEEVVLMADVQLILEANPKAMAKGLVMEAMVTKQRGSIATVIVQNGTLKTGDVLQAGAAYGKVRMLLDDKSSTIQQAVPSTVAQIIGLNSAPMAGDAFQVVATPHEAQEAATLFAEKLREQRRVQQSEMVTLSNLAVQGEGQESLKTLRIILKADVVGSIDAIKNAIFELPQDYVRVVFIRTEIGDFTDSDIEQAWATRSMLLGFNLKKSALKAEEANSRKIKRVKCSLHNIIYSLIDDVKVEMESMIGQVSRREMCGTAYVKQVFKGASGSKVAGIEVLSGYMGTGPDFDVEIQRNGKLVYAAPIMELRRFRDLADRVEAGTDCGLSLEGYKDWQEDDQIRAYHTKMVTRTLDEAKASVAAVVED